MGKVGALLVGLVLVSCGGRAERAGSGPGDSQPGSGNAGGTPGAAGDSKGAKAGGGAASSTGSTMDLLDGETPGAPQPPVSVPSAIFWGSDSSGWKIGNWFFTSDRIHDVGLDAIDPPRDGSTKGRHVSGAGFESGAVLWLQLDHPAGRNVDLSAYSGIGFWARLASPSSTFTVALNDGSRPEDSGVEGSAPKISLMGGPEWQHYLVPFGVFGVDHPSAMSIDFHVGDGGESFDLWIDDLALLCYDSCP